MSLFVVFVFSLGLSVVSCVNFITVHKWGFKEMDYAWPTEASRQSAIEDGTFKPGNFYPHFMAFYEERIFLSLQITWNGGIPATLVSLPTSSANSAPPKLAPFPNWLLHNYEQDRCDTIFIARGIEVDRSGHLWVVDEDNRLGCMRKLSIFDLNDGDKNVLVHNFDSNANPRHIVIDETPDNKQFAYITDYYEEHIIVFDRDERKSWLVKTEGKRFFSSALSHQEESRRLHLCDRNSKKLFSVSAHDLRSSSQKAPSNFTIFTGKWEAEPYRMLIDNSNVLYAAFFGKRYFATWHISRPFSEQHFYQEKSLKNKMPIAFALDANGTFWMMERDETTRGKPRHKLLKSVVGAGSHLDSNSEVTSWPLVERKAPTGSADRVTLIAVISGLAFILVCSCVVISWQALKMRKTQSPTNPTYEDLDMHVNFDEPGEYDDVGTEEPASSMNDDVGRELPVDVVYEEIQTASPMTPPNLYERPRLLTPGTPIVYNAGPSMAEILEQLGMAPPVPGEYDDVGPDDPVESDYVQPVGPYPVLYNNVGPNNPEPDFPAQNFGCYRSQALGQF